MKRQKDHGELKVDNSQVMDILMQALEGGDMICLFPEGMSRYHPKIAPLKTGVARIASDILSRNRENPEFEMTILTCSLTYMHREHFRSDVLVTFNPPINLKVKDHPNLLAPADFGAIKELTSTLQAQISLGTIDAPSWEIVQIARTATRLYAPFGTQMSLGNYVRVLRTFVDAFTAAVQPIRKTKGDASRTSNEEPEVSTETDTEGPSELRDLMQGLRAYQDKLNRFGLKDDRIRRPVPRILILSRLLIRMFWFCVLFIISLPGLLLCSPMLIVVNYQVKRVKRSGKPSDTWDEITQTKLVYGLATGLCIWVVCVLATLPLAPITAIAVPAVMWLTLRWLEDGISDFRACMSLSRLLWIGKPALRTALQEREVLHKGVLEVAREMGLPDDPSTYFVARDSSWQSSRGQVMGKWDSGARYFSLRRRRKRDWNEVLRLYDKVDYPDAS